MNIVINILADHIHFLLNQLVEFAPKETGGILIGNREKDHLKVLHVIGPGPKAVHTKHSFIPDNDFHTEQVAHYYKKSKGSLSYIGDWHTHPNARAYLSERDKTALKNIAAYDAARLANPVMIILGTHPLELKCWVLTQRKWPGVNFQVVGVELPKSF